MTACASKRVFLDSKIPKSSVRLYFDRLHLKAAQRTRLCHSLPYLSLKLKHAVTQVPLGSLSIQGLLLSLNDPCVSACKSDPPYRGDRRPKLTP